MTARSTRMTEIYRKEKISGYEKCREERIKENMERMKRLGIFDLSLKLKSPAPPKFLTKNNNIANGASSSVKKTPQRLGPIRRSSRLSGATPVSYNEVSLSKKGLFETEEELLREGYKPEVYTDQQKKLLGDTNMSWTLFVDGYGQDGKRIYDPIRGKTCHQCRQKTLGHRTQCSQCCKVQGQFCGDCLYMRYGENVLEALQNPEWVCPVCRGICNCSLCRQAKGWPPTGIMYKKISQMGFKSVAHYLLQTEGGQTTELEKEGAKVPVSAKRLLAFSSEEAASKLMESANFKDDPKESVELEFGKDKMNGDDNNEKLDGCNSTPKTEDQKLLMPKPKNQDENNVETEMSPEDVAGNVSLKTGPNSVNTSSIDVVTNKEDSIQQSDKKSTTRAGSKRKAVNRCEPLPDSIGARLRARRRICSS